MVIVYVKHYLNKAGLKFFQETWFPKVQGAISQQKGFISVDTYPDKCDYSCVNITVKFEDDKTLEDWVDTDAHAEVINALDPYRTGKTGTR